MPPEVRSAQSFMGRPLPVGGGPHAGRRESSRLFSVPHCVLPTAHSILHSCPIGCPLSVSCHIVSVLLTTRTRVQLGPLANQREKLDVWLMFQARLFRGVSWKPRGSHRRGVRVATLRECWTSTPIAAHYLCISPSRFGERTAGSYSTHPVLKATFRALGALPCHLDPETQSSALLPLSPWDMTCVVFPVVRD